MDLYKKIGNNIKKKRLEKKYTIKDLAKIINLDYKYFENIEKNGVDGDITLEILSKISSGLEINILDLFK